MPNFNGWLRTPLIAATCHLLLQQHLNSIPSGFKKVFITSFHCFAFFRLEIATCMAEQPATSKMKMSPESIIFPNVC